MSEQPGEEPVGERPTDPVARQQPDLDAGLEPDPVHAVTEPVPEREDEIDDEGEVTR